jgi:hypothetical protein
MSHLEKTPTVKIPVSSLEDLLRRSQVREKRLVGEIIELKREIVRLKKSLNLMSNANRHDSIFRRIVMAGVFSLGGCLHVPHRFVVEMLNSEERGIPSHIAFGMDDQGGFHVHAQVGKMPEMDSCKAELNFSN